MRRHWLRLREFVGADPTLLDAVLATGLLIAALASLSGGVDGTHSPRTVGQLGYLLVAVGVAPYYVRRRWPFAVLLAATGPVVALIALGVTPGVLGAGLFIACYTVAAWSSRPRRVAAATLVGVMLVGVHAAWPDRLSFVQLVENVVLFATSFVLGEASRARRETAALAAARAELLERHQAGLARQQVTDERLRLARELHDVVAHSLGVIAVQAGVGAHLLDRQPEQARRSLEAISTTSRESLTEVRALLGMLRADDVTHPPLPGLAELGTLLARTRRAGVEVDVHHRGREEELPDAVNRAAYVVLQEALTNVVRHAPGAHADVTIVHEPDRLVIDVSNDAGPHPVKASAGSGAGLPGMREQVRAWGGRVEAGPRPDDGFGVRVVIPMVMSP